MKFVWDDDKNIANQKKHGISFESASRVFDDLMRLEIYDIKHNEFEDRYYTIGFVEDVIVVVYVERKHYTRIISARSATNTERRQYYAGVL